MKESLEKYLPLVEKVVDGKWLMSIRIKVGTEAGRT